MGMTRSGQVTKGRLDQTGGERRKVAVKVKLRTVARKKVVARREKYQSEVLQALPVRMRSRRIKSGPGSSEELTKERKHSQANPGSPTPCTVPTTQMTSKSTGGCTSATGRRTA